MATVSNFAVIFLLPYFLTLSFANGDDLLITTKDGQVQGKLLPVLNGTVRGFLGIPYANPPVGQLRFRAPEPVNAWQGVKNATSYSNTCTQLVDKSFPGFSGAEMWNPNTPLSEDCLYLNVWAPRVNKTQNSTLAPVMVWIFGGGFTSGTSSLELYDGRYLVKSEGVIVVSMNYRVGALGFLSLPDNPNIRGNAGLMDQRLALKWVVNNIAAFGGDPSKVTLFGESVGALSVGFHLISPGSYGLFQRAIMESGSPSASWSTVSLAEAWKRATKLGMLLGCSTNAAELESCLQNADAAHIATVQHGVMTNPRISDIAFAPVIDGDFLPDDVDVLLSSPSLPKKEVLLGVNHDEGTYFLVYSVPGLGITGESLINRTQFLHGVDIMFRLKYNLTKETIIFQYTDWADKQNGTKNRDSLNRMLSDFMFICPTQDFAYRYAKNGGMPFLYYFVHQSSVNPWPAWMGVMHGYEIEFVFGNPLNPSLRYTQQEVNMSKRFMKYWANFARTGNPDGNWPLFTPENKEYVVLDTKAPETKLNLRANDCEFWNTLLPQIRTMEANQQNSRANQFTLHSTYIFFFCVSAVLYTL